MAIFGASGTTGIEAARLVDRHPNFELAFATSRQNAGQSLRNVDASAPNYRFVAPSEVDLSQIDLALLCLPHGQCSEVAGTLLTRGIKVVDLSGDHRLRNRALHEQVYGTQRDESWANQAVYGLTEFAREDIAGAQFISNPGCYPTCSAIALRPLTASLEADVPVIINALSGVSGAGRAANPATHFCNVVDDVRPYKLGHAHRHCAEIEQTLHQWSGLRPRVIFCPHVVPIERGMLVTCVVTNPGLTAREIHANYQLAYEPEAMIEVLDFDTPARIRSAARSNRAVVGVHPVDGSSEVIITCAIDNLLKGASGQAIQNANLMFGWPDSLGLNQTA